MNCKFKFHLRAALPRGAARPAGLCRSGRACRRSRWSSAEFGGRYRAGGAPPAGGMRFTVLRIPRFALKNRVHWLCGQACANRAGRRAPFSDFQVHGSRSKTEFFGFAGRRARTAPAGGLLFPDFQVCGSRSKTEFFGFAGRRARTVPRSVEKRCTEGSVSASVHLFPLSIIFPKGKN